MSPIAVVAAVQRWVGLPWRCRFGFHDDEIIATCCLPDEDDPSQTCRTCAPLRECRRCKRGFTW